MIRVLLIDDHPIVHDGVAAVLRAESDIRVIGSAEAVDRAIAQITPDSVIVPLDRADAANRANRDV